MGHGSEVPGLFSDFALRLTWQPYWLIKHAQRRWGGVQELKKTCLLQGEGWAGGLHIKYRKATRLVYAHYSQTDTDAPSPHRGLSPSFSFYLSLSLQDQALCHPTPIQNSSGNKELITANWMRKKMESDWMCCGASEISILQDVKLDYHSLLRHPLHLILFISSTNAASY